MTSRKGSTDEEWERAAKAAAHRRRGLSDAQELLKQRLKEKGVREVWVMSPTGVFIFYETEKLLAAAKRSGETSEVIDTVRETVLEVGRDPADLVVEFDSHENVVKHYRGDYFLRLR